MKAWSPCGPFLEAAGRSSEVYFCQSWQHPENQLVDRWQTKAFQSCLAQEKEPFEELLNLTWPSAQAFYQLFKSSDEIFEILKKQDLVLGCLLAWHKTTQEVNIENKKQILRINFFNFTFVSLLFSTSRWQPVATPPPQTGLWEAAAHLSAAVNQPREPHLHSISVGWGSVVHGDATDQHTGDKSKRK